MHRVRKGPEPPCLAACRRELQREQSETHSVVASDWDKLGGCAKHVRSALVRDQDALCAYCGRRLVRPLQDLEQHLPRPHQRTDNSMKIEHFAARSIEPQRMFDWDNLLGVCSGHFVIRGRTIHTCDSARGNRPLHIHPVAPLCDITALFPVHDGHLRDKRGRSRLGEIMPQSDAATADTTTLNLNADPLVADRADEIRRLRVRLSKDDSTQAIQRLLNVATVPASDGLPPYAHVAAAYLRKKLRQRAAQ